MRIMRRAALLALSGCLVLSSAIPAVAMAQSLDAAVTERSKQSDDADSVDNESLFTDALLSAEQVFYSDLKATALVEIASAFVTKGETQKAELLLQQATALSVEGEHYDVLPMIAKGYLKLGNPQAAIALLATSLEEIGDIRSYRSRGYDTLKAAIDIYAEISSAELVETELQSAYQIASEIEDSFSRLRISGQIAIAYSALDSSEVANAGITRMEQLIREQDRSFPEPDLTRIAEAWARKGEERKAIALLNEIVEDESSSPSDYIYRLVAPIYPLLKDTELAKEKLDILSQSTLSQIEKAVSEESENRYSGWAMVADVVANAYIDIGEEQSAHQTLSSALSILSDADRSEYTLYPLSQFARTYGRLEDIPRQQEILQQTFEIYTPDDLPEPNQLDVWQAITFLTMSNNYALLSDELAPEKLAVLLQVAEENNFDTGYTAYLPMLAEAAKERGDTTLVTQLLDKAIRLVNRDAQRQYGAESSAQMLAALASIHGELSDMEAAVEGLQRIRETARTLSESQLKQELLSAIAQAYASQAARQAYSET